MRLPTARSRLTRLAPIGALACLPMLAACADQAAPASALWPAADTTVAAAPMRGVMEEVTMGPVRLYQAEGAGVPITRIENTGGSEVEVVYQLLGGPYQTVQLAPGAMVEVGSLAGRLIAVR